MPALSNPRHEQFATAVASGVSAREAYTSIGYKTKNAHSSAARLKSDTRVAARIAELCHLAASIPQASQWLNRNYVLQGLKGVFDKAMATEKLGDAIRALELIGKEIGMFVTKSEHRFVWNGDPSALDEQQLANLTESLEALAYGKDEARRRAEQKRVLSEAGSLVVDVESEPDVTVPRD